MPLKGFYYIPARRGHAIPFRATREALGFGQEAEAGARGKAKQEPLLGLLQEWQGRTG